MGSYKEEKENANFKKRYSEIGYILYRDNNGMLGNIKKEAETGEDKNGFKSLLVI